MSILPLLIGIISLLSVPINVPSYTQSKANSITISSIKTIVDNEVLYNKTSNLENGYKLFDGNEIEISLASTQDLTSVKASSTLDLEMTKEWSFSNTNHEATGRFKISNKTSTEAHSIGFYLSNSEYFGTQLFYVPKDVHNVSLSCTDIMPSVNDVVTINSRINGDRNLIPNEDLEYSWSIKDQAGNDYSNLIETSRADKISFVPHNIENGTSLSINYTLKQHNKSYSDSEEIIVSTLAYPSKVKFLQDQRHYYINDDTLTFDALISKDTKPSIVLNDNNSIQYEYYKIINNDYVYEDEHYEKIRLYFEILIPSLAQNSFLIGIKQNDNSYSYYPLGIKGVDQISEIEISTITKIVSGNKSVTFTALINNDDILNVESLVWSISGETSYIGSEFTYVFKNGGSYNVQAKLDTIVSNSVTVNVKYSTWEMIFWYTLFAVSIIVGIILYINFKKQKRLSKYDIYRRDIQKLQDQLNYCEKKYKANQRYGKFKMRIGRLSIQVIKQRDNFEELFDINQVAQYESIAAVLKAIEIFLSKMLSKNDPESITMFYEMCNNDFEKIYHFIDDLKEVLH